MVPVRGRPGVAPRLDNLHGFMLPQLPEKLDTGSKVEGCVSVAICSSKLENMLGDMSLDVVGETNLHQAFVGSCLDGQFVGGGAASSKLKELIAGFQGSEPEAFLVGVALPSLIQIDCHWGRVPEVWRQFALHPSLHRQRLLRDN